MNRVYRVCKAMEEAGVVDGESKEGIEFCLGCPYPDYCVFYEGGKIGERKIQMRERIKELQAEGKGGKEIAKELKVSTRTILRHLT